MTKIAVVLNGYKRLHHLEKQINAVKSQTIQPHEIIKVDCFRLDRILDKHNIKYADFCSIDTEGTELNVIKSINWDNYLIEYICVEKNNNEQKIMDYLKPYGYVRVNTILPLSGDMLLKKI